MKQYDQKTVWGREVKGIANWYALATARLLDKGLIRVIGEFPSDKTAFAFTPLGFVVFTIINSGLRQFPDGEKVVKDNSFESTKEDTNKSHNKVM